MKVSKVNSKSGSRRIPHLTPTLSPPIGWERRGNGGRRRLVLGMFVEQRQILAIKIKVWIIPALNESLRRRGEG